MLALEVILYPGKNTLKDELANETLKTRNKNRSILILSPKNSQTFIYYSLEILVTHFLTDPNIVMYGNASIENQEGCQP